MIRKAGVFLLITLVAFVALAEEPEPGVLDDALLDKLEGRWRMEGTLMGEPVEYALDAEWVLGHQFLLLKMHDVAEPSEYEANIYLGFDSSRDRYVVHWLDRLGGKASSTLGFGERQNGAIELFFDYPSGQFRDTFTFDSSSDRWHFAIDVRNKSGEWSEFARYMVVRRDLGE